MPRMLRLPVTIWIGIVLTRLFLWQGLTAYEHEQVNQHLKLEATVFQHQIAAAVDNQLLALERMTNRWQVRGGTPRPEWEADALIGGVGNDVLIGGAGIDQFVFQSLNEGCRHDRCF